MDHDLDIQFWNERLIKAEAEVEAAVRQRDGIRKILEGAELLQGSDSVTLRDSAEVEKVPPFGGDAPRGRDAIRLVMRDGRAMKQKDIAKTIRENGLIDPGLRDPESAIRVTLRRMWKAGELEKPGDGVYRLPVSSNGSAAQPQSLEEVTS